MDKINFLKAIETLKNTECSAEEKIQKFNYVYSYLTRLSHHLSFKTFLANGVQILLLFCEDNDSNIRISAEENLNRVIRMVEKQNQIVLIQIELYHEIKKNGNERSLKVCLNLFSHFTHNIKHRRRKVYAQNLVPCMVLIGKRPEPLVIESFVSFVNSFSKHLLNCLCEYEVMKLIDLFVENLSAVCAIKRRCSAQNIRTMLDHLIKKSVIIKTLVAKIQENIVKDQEPNLVIGTLNLLRLLMPLLVVDSKDQHSKIIEILETCLNSLKLETNHSIINANLEVINELLTLSAFQTDMKTLLIDSEMHKEILLSRHSALLGSRKSSADIVKQHHENFLQLPTNISASLSTPNRSLGDFSDVEGDSFKSTDFEENISSSSPGAFKNVIGTAENMSLKSADSINSFFSSILTHSNTDSVSKFFKKSSTESPSHQPKSSLDIVDDKSIDITINNLKDDNIDCHDSQALPDTTEFALDESIVQEETLEIIDTSTESFRELYIGTLYDQSIVDFIVRFVASKYLLEGLPKTLISDHVVRVSIKNLALSVIAACVELKWNVLLLKLSKDFTNESMMVESLLSYLVDEDLRLEEEEKKRKNSDQGESSSNQNAENFLEIKDDHFGECTTAAFLDYFSPLSKTIDDHGLISLKNRIYEEKTKDRDASVKKISQDLNKLLLTPKIDDKQPLMETTLKMPDDKDCQFVVDILLYSSHGDPVLRSNVYTICGNFIKNILEKNLDFEKVLFKHDIVKESLDFNKLIRHLCNGLQDEIHSVVKQTLAAWENCVNLVLPVIINDEVIDSILRVSYNKYWLVQIKYCDVITKIDLSLIDNQEHADTYRRQILQQLFIMMKDNDFRVRNYAGESIAKFILKKTNFLMDQSPLKSFILQNIWHHETIKINSCIELTQKYERDLSKLLYIMTNFLMDVKEKNHQFGVIYSLNVLIKNFSPSEYSKVWKEFNILNILTSYINRNSSVALDISCHCDMLEIISALLASHEEVQENSDILSHLLKLLNIYSHLISNSKPLILSKGKSDIFTSSKELAQINSLGFFSNDQFYLKLYLVLKNSYDSYRMTINQEAEMKLKNLLRLSLNSLQILLELKSACKDDGKLIQEIVHYLNQLMSFQAEDCILTSKILLKFVFRKNFAWCKFDVEKIYEAANENNHSVAFDHVCSLKSVEMIFDDSLIKSFDAIVIYSLRLFSKSPAKLQTNILDLLCQLLEFNVNYMQLDAKKIFVEFVLRQLEYTEDGLVIDGEILTPKIIEFLIHLTKLKDKKLITMPKIINLVDVQLAATNLYAKECGIQALLTLSKEIFFKTYQLPPTTDEAILEAHTKDTNALKEVTLSMMIKFIHHKDVQQNLEWILLKSKEGVDENEIYQSLLDCIKDDNCHFHIIKSISKNILLESKNFKLLVENYWKMIELCETGSVEKITFIQKNVLMMAEEVYLVNHIKLVHQKQNMSGNALDRFLEGHYKYLKKLLVDDLRIEAFLSFIKFENSQSLAEDFKTVLNVKEILECASYNSIDHIIKFFLIMEKSLDEIESVVTSCNNDFGLNHRHILNVLHENIFEIRSDINAWETEEIMTFFKTASKAKILLKYCQNQLMKSLLEDVEISRIIIRKLSKVPLPIQKVKFILENSHNACFVDMLLFLISIEARAEIKILQFVMVKKLHSQKGKIQFGDLIRLKDKLCEYEVQQKFVSITSAIDILLQAEKPKISFDYTAMNAEIHEGWLLEKIGEMVVTGKSKQVAEVLFEIKSESKLLSILTADNFNIKLLSSLINVSFEKMLRQFKFDCITINPHLNYMKISPLLKTSCCVLLRHLDNENDYIEVVKILSLYMAWICELQKVTLIYVDIKLTEKFIADHFLRNNNDPLKAFIKRMTKKLSEIKSMSKIELILKCTYLSFLTASTEIVDNELIVWIFEILQKWFKHSDFVVRYQNPQIFDEQSPSESVEMAKRIIFIAKIQEAYEDGELKLIPLSAQQRSIINIAFEVTRFLLRQNKFYQYSMTPYEIIFNYRHGDNMLDSQCFTLKQIPIEYLSDSDLLERYIRRINRYGFTQRKEFEEIFMTLLVLINQCNEMQEAEEQFCVKQLCLQMNVDLILSCFRHQNFENKDRCNVAHLSRCEKWAKMEMIGVKKLHHIQEILNPNLNVFYQPNLERIDLLNNSNAIATKSFSLNQYSLSYTWHLTNEASKQDHIIKNMTFAHAEKLEIDYKSALQLIYDLMTQMIDENPTLVLPQLGKLVDILDNNDQFKWINKKMQVLYESTCSEDTISHQYIVYLLCRSAAVLVPSLSDLQQIVPIINKYLGCNHMFVRNATLHGLLCLCESLIKTNTAIGTINDELKLLRTTIMNYTNKHGIVFESTTSSSSSQHDKLVWTLNFYILENTLKFGDCNELLIDTIISANNVLKRTNDINLYYLIITGLERLCIIDYENRLYRDKIEKLSLDLMKIENNYFSLGGLKLLVTCMYMGSLEQLENTEKSNGIVQDEPEIVMHSTEKIEILFSRIRVTTAGEAEVYGRVLEKILKDLLPPNEVLTKIIKELLILNQSNVIVIAKIIHQVFRSAIDSSFLPLLQEWLICSLPNFFAYPNQRKSIWFLTLIFISSTLNIHLLKLFPMLLDEKISDIKLHNLFVVSTKDFYEKLSEKQQAAFRYCFKNSHSSKEVKEDLFENLLNHL